MDPSSFNEVYTSPLSPNVPVADTTELSRPLYFSVTPENVSVISSVLKGTASSVIVFPTVAPPTYIRFSQSADISTGHQVRCIPLDPVIAEAGNNGSHEHSVAHTDMNQTQSG